MTGRFFDIEVAFQTALNAISSKPFIEFEGMKPYIPALGTRYWRTNHIPVNSDTVAVDGLIQNTGLYQVDILCPTGKGLKQMMTDMDLIADAFNTVVSISSNSTKVQLLGVSRGRVTREESWLFGFVRINYICYSF